MLALEQMIDNDKVDMLSNCVFESTTHIARSLAAVVHTDHNSAVEAGSPAGGALRVRDDGDVDSLQLSWQGTRSYNILTYVNEVRL